jgi:YHS domain-containing protein
MGDHKKIVRKVTNIPNGVETITESSDPAVVRQIQAHAVAMQKRIKEGRPIRMWDPLFAEIFRQHSKIEMSVTPTAKGVRIVETSKDTEVVALIQAHAQGVNGFVKEGMAGMHKEHPLPGKPAKPAEPKPGSLAMGDGKTTCPVTGEPVNKSVSSVIGGRKVYFCCPGCIEKVKRAQKAYLAP